MSEYQDTVRPSKRRRRDSSSRSPSSDRDENSYNSGRRQQTRSSRPEQRKMDRSQERRYGSVNQRPERSTSPVAKRRDGVESSRRRRSRSRDTRRDMDPKREGRSYRYRERSSSPRSGRSRRNDGDRSGHDDRRHDRKRDHAHRKGRSPSPKPFSRSKAPLPSQNDAFVATANPSSALEKHVDKQKPNFGLTGKLAAASNTIQTANQTIVLKYHEPPEARKPPTKDQWRLYVFKEEEILDTVELSEQSCWLIGRETAVADFAIEHPSCSKQHAVIQFRYLEKRNEFGDKIGKVKPYVIDLESANGTKLNEELIPAAKYVELRDKDVLQFGQSTREYVIQLPPPA